MERTVKTVLKTADSVLAKARSEAKGQDPGVLAVIDEVAAAVRDARQDMRRPGRRTSIAEITYRFRQRVDAASRGLVDADVAAPRPTSPSSSGPTAATPRTPACRCSTTPR